MESTNLNIRTDKEVKIAAERIFEELGLNSQHFLETNNP